MRSIGRRKAHTLALPCGTAARRVGFAQERGLDVLLLDKFDFPRDKTCGDAVGPRSLHVLRDMGILDDVLRIGFRVNGVEIFAPGGRSVAAPVPEHDELPSYGLIVPRLCDSRESIAAGNQEVPQGIPLRASEGDVARSPSSARWLDRKGQLKT